VRSLTTGSSAVYLPLLVADRMEGVLAVELANQRALGANQRPLLEAFATQLAVMVEKERLARAHRRAEVLLEAEKLQKTLFDSVSHELKTPIAAISAALDQPVLDRFEIARANDRLRRSVEHLLDATRIESGMLKPTLEWCDPVELARDAIARAGLAHDQVCIDAPAELPSIRIDAGLLQQALATLLHNGATHGNSLEPCVLAIRHEEDLIRFDVTDRGPGLAHGHEEKLFEKFYRGPRSSTGGLGLGLSIARRLAEAHGGTLTSENRPAGGARFTLRVPIGGELHLPHETERADH
jgi:two-component system sensor histidine kinase KdpD